VGDLRKNNFQKCSSLRDGKSLRGRDFFLPEGEKSEGVYLKGFRFSAKHDVFSTLREELVSEDWHPPNLFSPDPSFKNFLILGF